MRRLLAWILIAFTLHPTFPALAVETLRKEGSAYFVDKDGDLTHDTDGTEPFADWSVVEVPGDYATIQAAIDSNDCKKGTTTANQGCRIVVAPGVYAEKFEIGATSGTSNYQYGVIVEGTGSIGIENSFGNPICGTTLTGDGTLDHSVISIDNAVGFAIRNLCIDMNTAAANDPKYGIAIGTGTAANTVNKHGTVENLLIFDSGASGGAAIRMGSGAGGGFSSDTAFNTLRNIYLSDVTTCVEVDGVQVVGNRLENVQCSNPTAAIGGISIGQYGGEMKLRDFYMTPGIDSQIGINIRGEAIGALTIDGCTFEWDKDNGTFINFDATTNTGTYRATTIKGCRFQPQTIAGTRHICVDWNRRGTLNLIGNSFESGSSTSRTCELDLNNPDASKASDIYFIGNDTQWAGTQADPRVTRTTTGGALRIAAMGNGGVFSCTGAASVGALNSSATGCTAGSGGGLASTDIDTSSELDTIVTDDTGSGALVFATSPALTTPNLGTPSALVLNNATGSLDLSTGTIRGSVSIETTSGTSHTLTAAEGQWIMADESGATQIDLPAVSSGANFCVYSTTAQVISINPNASENIFLAGATVGAGDEIDSPGTLGDFACLLSNGTNWYVLGLSGTWVDGGAS